MNSLGRIFFRFFRVVMVLAIAVGISYLLFSSQKEPEKLEKQRTAPSVKVVSVIPSSKVMTVEAFGTVKPRKSVKIAAEVPGRIDMVHPSFVAGGSFRKNDVLIGIDQRSYSLEKQLGEIRVKQAETDISTLKQDIMNLKMDKEIATANLELSTKELERFKALNKQQFASNNSLEKIKQQHLQAQSQLQVIDNRLALAGFMMEQKTNTLSMAMVDSQRADLAFQKTRIVAPFDGLVLEKYSEEGEYVNPGQPLGVIYQKDGLDVDVRIPMEKMTWLERFFQDGATPDAKVRMANLDGPDVFVWDAKVARVLANIDETTRTLPMTIEIIPADSGSRIYDLKPGTFVQCSIIGDTYDNLYVLPRYLLKTEDTVLSVRDGHLKILQVEVLRKFEENVYIKSGLNPGEQVITSPLPGAVEGMALTVITNGDQ